MNFQNAGKAAELQIVIWFLESHWEVFAPVVDARQTDFVVRVPQSDELLAVQVKSKQRDTKNKGQLQNHWKQSAAFDYLVFIEGSRYEGFVFPKSIFPRYGTTMLLRQKDKNNYPTGKVRPVFNPYRFDLSTISGPDRTGSFISRFREIHQAECSSSAKPAAR